MAGTSAVDSEYVIKLGRVRSVRAKPVNSPYWLVAAEAATPAIARLCATTIGSKNHDRFPIKRYARRWERDAHQLEKSRSPRFKRLEKTFSDADFLFVFKGDEQIKE